MGKNCSSCADKGLLIIRLGLGALMTIHGAMIVFGGQAMRDMIGGMAMGGFMPTAAGLIAGLVMLLGGLAFMTGIMFKAACAGLAIAMIVAAVSHFRMGQGLYDAGGPRHSINLVIVFVGMMGIGAGRYSLCSGCCSKKKCSDGACSTEVKKDDCCGTGCCSDKKDETEVVEA